MLKKFVGKFPFLTCSHQVPTSNPCQDAQYPNLIYFVVLLSLSTNMPKWHLISGRKLFYSHTFELVSFANYLKFDHVCCDIRLLRSWVRISPGAWMFVCFVNVVCCQVEVSVTNRSLVQKSPADCGVTLCVIYRNLLNEEAMARVGPQRHKKKYCDIIRVSLNKT